jgi:hypothetical protein
VPKRGEVWSLEYLNLKYVHRSLERFKDPESRVTGKIQNLQVRPGYRNLRQVIEELK